MLNIFGIDVLNVIYPMKVLFGLILIGREKPEVVFRKEIEKSVELFLNGGQALFLEYNDVLPTILFADREDRTIGKQTVLQQAYWQAGEAFLEPFGQTIERFEFPVPVRYRTGAQSYLSRY
jgi:hypothetical protein